MVVALTAAGTAWAADHSAHGGGAKDGGAGKGGMHGMHHPEPGSVEMTCHAGHGGMPPHFCAPHYKVMSSVPGVSVGAVELMAEKQLMVTLKAMPGLKTPALVIAGGGGDLAGAVTVAAGCKGGAVMHVDLVGNGSLYQGGGYHLHLFPFTGR